MRRLRQEQGTVLLLVLVVVALLTALLSEFAFSTLVDLRLAESFRDRTKAYYLAKGGIRFGRMLLQEDTNDYDGRDETWAQAISGYPVGDGVVSISIEDHDGRLNLNRLVTSMGNTDVVIKERLLRLFDRLEIGDGDELTAALIDWLDPDNEPEEQGAESDYYRGLATPYQAKNGSFDDLQELLQVRGFTAAVFKRLAPHVTIWGDRLVNVNTASRELLLALADEMETEAAEAIVSARQKTPLTAIRQLRELPELEQSYGFIFRYIKVTSSSYRVAAWAETGSGISTLTADIKKDRNQILYFKVD
ncbi:MAG: type II secretion system minor pseudopilin GspK [Syntrophotaleaceae bacterium]